MKRKLKRYSDKEYNALLFKEQICNKRELQFKCNAF